MGDLKTKYSRLTNQIYRTYIFYLPLSIVPEESLNENNEGYFSKYFDKLIFIDDSELVINPEEFETIKIFQQAENLTNNTFKIVKYKKSLTFSDLNFIIDKYLEQIRVYTRISELLLEYYEVNCPKKNLKIKSAFIYQFDFFKNHLNEIEKLIEVKPIEVKDNEIFNHIKKSYLFTKLKKEEKEAETTYFRDHILHDKKEEIEKILIENYRNIKGIKIRYLLDYFEESGFLSIYHGKRQEIYNSLKKSFDWDIGQYNSIFGFEYNKVKNTDHNSFKKGLSTLLQNFIG